MDHSVLLRDKQGRRIGEGVGSEEGTGERYVGLVFEGVKYPLVSPESIPSGMVTVPLLETDFFRGVEYETTIAAGVLGWKCANWAHGLGKDLFD
jgi:hypothetical protein